MTPNDGVRIPASRPLVPRPNNWTSTKRTKANLKIASLNMRGRFHNGTDKWLHINQFICDEKITILALQETHLDPTQATIINEMFSDTLHIIALSDPDHCASKGIALVINKRILGIKDISHYDLAPGRALLVSTLWYQQERINILNIYAPNDPNENSTLWKKIHNGILNLPQPDIILAHCDNPNIIETWQSLKSHLSLTDGWQATFPTSLNHTFSQSAQHGGHQSRIDQVYVPQDKLPYCKEWTISPSPIPTDHQLISVRISKQSMPFISKGRWILNPALLHDKEIMANIHIESLCLQEALRNCTLNHTNDQNLQTVFKAFKEKVIAIIRNRAKKIVPMTWNRIDNLQDKLQETLNDNTIPDNDRLLLSTDLQE
ncbi:Endonuclease/exonuclease/phosphatase [Scleroderma yunnanense]